MEMQMQAPHESKGCSWPWGVSVKPMQFIHAFLFEPTLAPLPLGVPPKLAHDSVRPSDFATHLLLPAFCPPLSYSLQPTTPTTAPFLTLAPLSGDLRQDPVVVRGRQITARRGGQDTT